MTNKNILLLEAQIADLQANLRSEKTRFLSEQAKALFNQYQNVKTVSFTAYTPYWNDGEECVYSANTDREYLTMDIDGGEMDYYGASMEWDRKIFQEFSDFLGAFGDDFWKETFGDHKRIEINSNGEISSFEYNHD